MRHSFRARPRLAAAAVLSLTGGLLAAAAPPAQADCVKASVWLYRSQEGRDYKYGPESCVGPDTGRENGHQFGAGTGSNDDPPGTINGAGFRIWYP